MIFIFPEVTRRLKKKTVKIEGFTLGLEFYLLYDLTKFL